MFNAANDTPAIDYTPAMDATLDALADALEAAGVDIACEYMADKVYSKGLCTHSQLIAHYNNAHNAVLMPLGWNVERYEAAQDARCDYVLAMCRAEGV